MKASRVVLGAVLAAALGGCAVYPVEPVGVYAAPAPVVVQPSISFGYSSGHYYGPRRHSHRRYWRH